MLQPGVVFSERYRIVRLLGEGGMGAVYEAEHTSVGRKVAIKVLHPEFARKPEAVERFEREAKAAAAIGHEHIIDVIDFGTYDGAPFMVMEHLKGRNLRERIERPEGRVIVPHGAAVYILRQVLSALAAAHRAKIIHRDLKPDNVFLITKAGTRDFVKLLDFGVSKIKKEDSENGGKNLTKTGAVMGTPYYMAPEQAVGKGDIDARADLYSAGVMLYQMVAGVLPFDAESQAELLLQIAYRTQPPASPRTYVPELPEALAAAILRALELDPAKRFASADEFSAALAPFEGPPTSFEASGQFRVSDVPRGSGLFSAPDLPSKKTLMDGSAPSRAVLRETPPPQVVQPSSASLPVLGPAAVTVPPELAPEARGRGALVAALVLIPLLGVGGAFAYLRSAGAASSASAPTATVLVTAPPVPTAVQIDLEGLPEGATVQVDGAPHEGSTLRFARGSRHALRIEAPQKQSFETTLTADRDRALAVVLLDVPTPAATAAVTAAPALPALVASAAPGAPAPPSGAPARPHGRPARTAPAAPAEARPTAARAEPRRSGGNPLLPVSNEF